MKMRSPGSRRSEAHHEDGSAGQALVEFALVIPIFLLILLGILDFGYALYSQVAVVNAAREGVHAAALMPPPHEFDSAAIGTARGALSGAGLASTAASYSVTCISGTSGSTVGCGSAGAGVDLVKVHISYAYHPFFPLLFGSTFTLSASEQMLIEN